MTLQPFEIDSSRMPLCLGSALRVPSYAYRVWGITGNPRDLRTESDRQYENEWKSGSSRQMQNVVEAITNSGLGNYSQMLRDANSDLVSRRVRQIQGRVNYLELGAGVSTINVYDRLASDGVDLDRVHATLIEPSQARLANTVAELEKRGLKKGVHFTAHALRDTDIPSVVKDGSQDIASYVAVLHHHAFLDTPLYCVHNALKKGGVLVIADWHNAMWEHPARVFQFLETFDWPTKGQDMDAFAKMYPCAAEKASELMELDAGSNRNIQRFWRSYAEIREAAKKSGEFRPEDDIWMLEAHRPVRHQNHVLTGVGYDFGTPLIQHLQPENPRKLVDDAGILYVTLAQK